ncbi:MAG TPA: RNA methyltransferase, partial [Acidimicrobiia bacterium]|nr:RNA methyltransferase [Acidimicrobiia bacterium]
MITSLTNDRVKDLVRLRERRHRDRTGRFLIEGYRELLRAVDAGVGFETLYICRQLFLGSNEDSLIERIAAMDAEIVEMAPPPFRKVSYRDRPEGLLAVAIQFGTSLADLTLSHQPLLLVAESIEKPGNLGTMLRTADAAGADAVIVADPTTDPFNPNVVRSSTGTLFTVPIAVGSTPDLLAWLRRHSIAVAATTPDTDVLLWDADLTGPLAVVIGAEQYGLSSQWLERADLRIRIPMGGTADSLN